MSNIILSLKHKVTLMKDSELLYKFGQRLKELRENKKWSLRDLEASTGIDHSDLSRYESGYIGPQLVTLYKLSQAYGITLSKLLDIEKDNTSKQ